MDHICLLDIRYNEFRKLDNGSKTVLIKGSYRKKTPYKKVFDGDTIYFVDDCKTSNAVLKASVEKVQNIDRRNEKHFDRILRSLKKEHQLEEAELHKMLKKRFLVLIELSNVERVNSFKVFAKYFDMSTGWCLVGNVRLLEQ